MFKERLIILFVFTGLLVLLGIFFLPKKENNTEIEEVFWIKKTHSSSKYECIFIGDSRIYRGVAPEIINEIIPDVNILNFGYSSGSMSKFMINTALKKIPKHSKKKIIVFGISPHSLTPNAAKDEHLLQELQKKKEEILSAKYLFPIKKIVSPVSPYYIYQQIFDIADSSVLNGGSKYYQEFYQDGWVASWKIPEDTTEAIEPYSKIFINNQCSEKILNELLQIIKQLSEKGYKVYAFRPPASYTIEKIEDSLSGYNEKIIKQKIKENNGVWIPLKKGKYHCYDGSHLIKEDAIKLSKDIALFIKENELKKRK